MCLIVTDLKKPTKRIAVWKRVRVFLKNYPRIISLYRRERIEPGCYQATGRIDKRRIKYGAELGSGIIHCYTRKKDAGETNVNTTFLRCWVYPEDFVCRGAFGWGGDSNIGARRVWIDKKDYDEAIERVEEERQNEVD